MKPLNMVNIRPLIAQSFFGPDSEQYIDYIRPIQGDWFVPTANPEEMISTWIGYSILSIEPKVTVISRTTTKGQTILLRNCKVVIRLAIVGPQAEDLANNTLWWDGRHDIKEIWEVVNAQLMNNPRKINTYLYVEEGFGSTLTWTTDLDFMVWMFQMPVDEPKWGGIILNGDMPLPSNWE